MPAHRPKTRKASPSPSAPASPAPLLLSAVRASVCALCAEILLLLLLCGICLSTADPTASAPIAALVSLIPASLFCGILCAKQSGAGGLPSGLLSGILLVMLLFSLGLLVPHGTAEPLLPWPAAAAGCTAISALGGYIFTHTKPRARKKRR